MLTTSARLFSILNSLFAEPTISDIISLKLCSSIANRFSKVNVSGFMSKFFPVSSINFCQCLGEGVGVGNHMLHHLHVITNTLYLSLRASFLRSANKGMESLNSLILSSNTWQMGRAFSSLGNLRRRRINSSIPSVSCSISRLAQRVPDHSSRAIYTIKI